MNRLFSYFSLIYFLLFMGGQILSQCDECTPDITCSSPDGMPTFCPEVLPPAVTGEFYSSTATFSIPSSIEVDGISVDLIEVSLASLTGVPLGLEIQPNNSNGIYYPSNGEEFGCVTICGTALVAGEYSVNISVDVLANAFGFETSITESFILSFTVLQGENSNSSFTTSEISGCAPLEVELTNLITGPGTIYSWNVNGDLYSNELNPNLIFENAGTYDVSLITSVNELIMTSLNVTQLNDNWSGDVEEFWWCCPDPFFNINGDGVNYTSVTIDEDETPNYTGLNIPLVYGAQYEVSFYDEDILDNDDLGAAIFIASAPGQYTITGNGNTAVITIEESITAQFEDTETIVVYETIDAYLDIDGDGYGDGGLPVDGCDLDNEYPVAFNGQDCNDEDATIYPGAIGTWAGIDNDCNTIVEDDEILAVYGCLEEGACNFNPVANTADESCEYTSCLGCTDPLATNYDPSALITNNSCIYNTCFGDFNNDGVITVSDLLTMLASFGCTEDCQTDLSGDEVVSVADLLELLAVYGTECE